MTQKISTTAGKSVFHLPVLPNLTRAKVARIFVAALVIFGLYVAVRWWMHRSIKVEPKPDFAAKAKAEEQKENFALAILYWDQALGACSDKVERAFIRCRLARNYVKLRKFSQAIVDLTAASLLVKECKPKDEEWRANILFNRAAAYALSRDFVNALGDYNRALEFTISAGLKDIILRDRRVCIERQTAVSCKK